MIPLDNEYESKPESAITHHIRTALGPSFSQVDDLASAVELYCDLHCEHGVISAYYIELLLARALIKSGQPHVARRLLECRTPAVDPCMAALAQEPCPHRIMRSLSSALLRPSRWATAGGRDTWTLDLRRLARDPLVNVELGLLPALRALLDEAAALWHDAGGRGGLALRGLGHISIERGEVLDYCNNWLETTALSRGWERPPLLLCLD